MQISYATNISAGRVGLKYDIMFDDVKTASVPAIATVGALIAKDPTAADGVFRAPIAAVDITGNFEKGIVLASHTQEMAPVFGNGAGLVEFIPANRPISMLRKGRVWVLAEDVITAGVSAVNVRFGANGANTQLGAFRGAADGAFTAVLPGARWITSTTAAGQLAVLEIDL